MREWLTDVFCFLAELFGFGLVVVAFVIVFALVASAFNAGGEMGELSERKAFCESVDGAWGGENCWKDGKIVEPEREN